jgi:hypothetical protein
VNGLEDYLTQVRHAMAGMDPRVREDILRELRSHIAESAAANGGDVHRAVEAMGPAVRVGREYRSVYGYGRTSKIVFVLVAAFLAALTLPVLQGATSSSGNPYYIPNVISFPFLVLVILWLLWVSVQAGSRAGAIAGIGAFAARVAAALVLILAPSGGIVTLDGFVIFLLSSVLLVPLGWLPGTAKKAWSRPVAQL